MSPSFTEVVILKVDRDLDVASHLKYNQKTSLKQAEAWQKPPVKHGQWTIPNW